MKLPPAQTKIELGYPKIKSGKVREVFDLGDSLLFVASDRLSAFDVVFNEGIPGKGAVLTAISNYWFGRLAGMMPHHLHPDGLPQDVQKNPDLARRSMRVRRGEIVPLECVVRGYLAGSAWAEYKQTGSACGFKLPSGLKESDKLPEPLFTPSTKAEVGHDENLTPDQARNFVGAKLFDELQEKSLALYRKGSEEARTKGIILADTKFEFARIDGKLVLADEALTPDSSRFWPSESYKPGSSPPSFDKQFVRDYLNKTGWNKQPPPPPLPEEVIRGTSDRYLSALEVITGQSPEKIFS